MAEDIKQLNLREKLKTLADGINERQKVLAKDREEFIKMCIDYVRLRFTAYRFFTFVNRNRKTGEVITEMFVKVRSVFEDKELICTVVIKDENGTTYGNMRFQQSDPQLTQWVSCEEAEYDEAEKKVMEVLEINKKGSLISLNGGTIN